MKNVLLENAIKEHFDQMEKLSAGSEEKSRAVDDLKGLYEIKYAQDQKERYIKLGIDVLQIVTYSGIYLYFGTKGFKFEEKGYFSSYSMKNILNSVKLFKK